MDHFYLKIYFLNCDQNKAISIISILAPLYSDSIAFHQIKHASELQEPDIIFSESITEAKRLKDQFPLCSIVWLTEKPEKWPEFFDDIWLTPMPKGELAYKFAKLREHCLQIINNEQTSRFFKHVLDTSPNLIWFKEQSGRHMLVNESFCKAVNKTAEDIHGQKHPYIWNVESEDPACIESERIVMETGKTHISEETIKTGEGVRLLTTYKSHIKDRHGNTWGTMGIGVDVTMEREFKNRLIQSNATLETIFTTMDCGILCHTLDGNRVISANPASLKLLGYTSVDDLQKGFHVLASSVIESDRLKLCQSIASLKDIGDTSNFEYRIILPDGQLRYLFGNAKIIEKDGELICQRLILDGTAQKLAEEQAKSEQERQHRELVRALSVDYQLVIVFDIKNSQDIILQLKDTPDPVLKKIFAFTDNFDVAFEEYIEKCVYPEDRAGFRQACSRAHLMEALDYDKIFYFNFRVLIDNQIHYYQLKAVRAGTTEHPLGIVVGISSVNEHMRKELENGAALAAALKDARKASESKSIFLSNMSHDIRTPMNAVVGYTTLALSQLDKRNQVENYLQKILASGKHLLSLINDILDMSHIESGKLNLDETLCYLPQIIEDLFNIVQPACDEKHQALTLNMDNLKHPWIYCDRLRLNQVLLNLLGNSVKYTPRTGSIQMTVIESETGVPDIVNYEFVISDTGIGMSKEFLERIFEPFERAQTSTIAGIQGTGLGMPIAKKIVTMMNGKIQVTSELNQGTEFLLTVPFRTGTEEDQNREEEKTAKDDLEARKTKNIRILLAEDNEMNQEIAQEFLTAEGYLVDIAENGQKAVEMLSEAGEKHYSIILMDVQMPVMNGYEATEMIRSLPDRELANIPIIALTANSFEEDKAEALQKGMSAHIAKPINFPVLFEKIKDFIDSQSGWEAV